MLVKDLLEDLKTMDPEAAVGFSGNGVWAVAGIQYGRKPGQSRGYVLLFSNGDVSPEAHIAPIKR